MYNFLNVYYFMRTQISEKTYLDLFDQQYSTRFLLSVLESENNKSKSAGKPLYVAQKSFEEDDDIRAYPYRFNMEQYTGRNEYKIFWSIKAKKDKETFYFVHCMLTDEHYILKKSSFSRDPCLLSGIDIFLKRDFAPVIRVGDINIKPCWCWQFEPFKKADATDVNEPVNEQKALLSSVLLEQGRATWTLLKFAQREGFIISNPDGVLANIAESEKDKDKKGVWAIYATKGGNDFFVCRDIGSKNCFTLKWEEGYSPLKMVDMPRVCNNSKPTVIQKINDVEYQGKPWMKFYPTFRN